MTHDMQTLKRILIAFSATAVLAGCSASGDHPGYEYAPNMYHSVPYDPFTQITDPNAGRWLTSIDYPNMPGRDYGHSEFFNSNLFNTNRMNMRVPPANTVKRNSQGWLPYRLPNDTTGLRLANRVANPLESTPEVLAEGKRLYSIYCGHCHGSKGEGEGKVAQGVAVEGLEKSAYAGVPNYKADALKSMTEGHIFHVITYGKGLMWPHGSQIVPEDRWKIAKYVKELQK